MNWWNTPWGELRLPLTNGGLVRYITLLIIWHLSIIGIGFWFGWNWPRRKRRSFPVKRKTLHRKMRECKADCNEASSHQ